MKTVQVKTLLVIGGGIEAVPSVQRALEMGVRVVVTDGDPRAPCFALVDPVDSFIASTYDYRGTIQQVRRWLAASVSPKRQLDGVIALVADVPLTVALVAKEFGLPCLPVSVAELGTDKLAMKRRLEGMGLVTAGGHEVQSVLDVIKFKESADQIVVKPFDSRGARGVVRITNESEMGHYYFAFEEAKKQSPTGRVLAEHWLHGQQVSTETMLLNNGFSKTFILDRNYSRLDEFYPFVIEDGADGPSNIGMGDNFDVIRCVANAARRLWGREDQCPVTFKGDVVLTPDGPAIIEFALRLSGGYMSSKLLPLMSGVDVVGTAIRLALGEKVLLDDVQDSKQDHVAIRYDIPAGATCHPDRKGHGIGTGRSRDEAIRAAQAALEMTWLTGPH